MRAAAVTGTSVGNIILAGNHNAGKSLIFVIRVGETELARDGESALCVQVERQWEHIEP